MDEIKKVDLSNRSYVLVAILAGGIVVSYLGGLIFQFYALPQNYPQQVVVFGTGKFFAKPDVATVSVGIRAEAIKSQDAVNRGNKIMADIINAVKESGVDEKDMQTTAYNLTPNYDYTEAGRVFRGYSLDQRISVKIRDFGKISEVLDKATANGANDVGDLQFTLDNPETAKAEARAKAIDQAKAKAESIFSQSGLKMGKLINVYEDYGMCGYGGCPQPMYAMGGEMMKDASVAPQIESGQLEFSITINLTYQTK